MKTENQTSRRGRNPLKGMALIIPGLRTIIEDKQISPYYRKKLAEKGFIGLTLEKEPGTMGRPKIKPILTTKGLRYWEKYANRVEGYLEARAA